MHSYNQLIVWKIIRLCIVIPNLIPEYSIFAENDMDFRVQQTIKREKKKKL